MHNMNNFASPSARQPAPGDVFVVKYGGNAMTGTLATDAVLDEIAGYRDRGVRVVLVHGGGPEIDRALDHRGIVTERIEGQRITSAQTLAITESVLCGTLNKALVRACIARGIPAVGISGQDGSLLVAEKATLAQLQPTAKTSVSFDDAHVDLGFVGKVVDVRTKVVTTLLDAGFLSVIAPLAIAKDGQTAYNVNGDMSAGAIAGALQAKAFFLITNVDRVRLNPDDATSGIESMTLAQARDFYASDACRQSMRPKLAAAIGAVESGTRAAFICAPCQTTIARALAGEGTVIYSMNVT